MIDGANYVALPLYKWMQSGFVPVRKDGHVDTEKFVLGQAPHFVEAYLCQEDPAKPGTKQYMSVQSIEPAFYAALLHGLGLGDAEGLPAQMDRSAWGWMKARLASIFLTKTRDQWARVFDGTDACCVPVLNAREAARHPHNVARGSFAPTPGMEGEFEPSPAPRLSRTPGHAPRPTPRPAQHTQQILADYGFTKAEIASLLLSRAAMEAEPLPRL
jgi:alpha-methylacyl-CoA racemase